MSEQIARRGIVGQPGSWLFTGGRGAIIGALAPLGVRRAFGPLGLALAGGYAAKKFYDSRKLRKAGVEGVTVHALRHFYASG